MRWGKNGEWVLFEKCILGPPANPYMIRWRLWECPWFRVYVHKICRSDDDRHLHDHPFNFLSIVLAGYYWEWRPYHESDAPFGPLNTLSQTRRRIGSVAYRRASDLHVVEIPPGVRACWTLIIAGRRFREWGFQTEVGWIEHREYIGKEYF